MEVNETLFERREIIQNELLDAVINADWFKSLRTIYNNLSRRYPDMDKIYPYDRAIGYMKNWQDCEFLSTPMNLIEYTKILLSEEWKDVLIKRDNMEMSVHTVLNDQDKNCITVFADHSYLQLFHNLYNYKLDVFPLEGINEPQVDKLMSISVLVRNEWWPLAWALIEKSTVETYSTVFEVLSSVHGIMKKPKKILLSYFEIELGDSIDILFPKATVICTMSVTKKLDSIKGKNYTSEMLKQNPKALRYYRKLLELNQLPVEEIESAFERLYKSTKILDNEFIQVVFNCYREWWIEKITPKRYSYFENDDIELAKFAKRFEFVDLPDVDKWKSVFKPLKIWQFTDRLLEIMIIIRKKIKIFK